MGRWIKIYEEIRDHWIYQNPLWYKWWTDMLFEASFKDSKVLVRKQIVDLKRGQLSGSISYFVKRWDTTKDQVIGFLKVLQNEGMIEKMSDKNLTIITICNYDSYQGMLNNKSDNLYDNKYDNMPDNNPDTNKECIEVKEINITNSARTHTRTYEDKPSWDEAKEQGYYETFKAQGSALPFSKRVGKSPQDVMKLLEIYMATRQLKNKGHKDFNEFTNLFLWHVENKKISLPVIETEKKVITGPDLLSIYG